LDVFPCCLGLTDGFRSFVLLTLQRFRTNLNGSAALFQLFEGGNIKIEILDGQPTGDLLSLCTDAFRIEHGVPEFSG